MGEGRRTLEERIRQGPLDLGELVEIMDDVFDEVAGVHALGRVDAALTPRRLVIDWQDGRTHAHLSPPPPAPTFLGVEPGAPDLPAFETVEGDFSCLAPEQLPGTMDIDRRADIHALGAMAFRALTGRRPFESSSAMDLIWRKLRTAPPTLESVSGRRFSALMELFVATAMAADRDRRYPRVEVARAAWREAARG